MWEKNVLYLKKKKIQRVGLNFQSSVYYMCQEIPRFSVLGVYIQVLLS